MSTYQTTIPCIVDTAARFKLFGQFFGAGFTTIGWVKQTGHGEQTDNGLTGSSYAWTGTFAAPTTVLAADGVLYVQRCMGQWHDVHGEQHW
jgi:hypothetical protein